MLELHACSPVRDCYVHASAGITHASAVGTVMKRSRGEAYDMIRNVLSNHTFAMIQGGFIVVAALT